jgi:hypothetical protein
MRFFLYALVIIFTSNFYSSIDEYLPLNTGYSSSNFGGTGLIVAPSARLQEEGTLKFGLSSFYPFEVTAIAATPFPWMEAVFRYTEIKNEKYGPASYSGNQTNKDKGFDFKFRLQEEGKFIPSIALGFRDLAGASRFSTEYLVASKRFNNLDITAGIAWGHLGRDSNISNPMSSINESFDYRIRELSTGGFNVNQWFSGDITSIFGGFEYHFKRNGLILKAEYDTSNPDLNTLVLPVSSRINYSFTYPFSKWVDLSFGNQRGNTFIFSVFLKGNYSKQIVPKLEKPKKVTNLNSSQKDDLMKNKLKFYGSLNYNLREENIYLQAATLDEDSLELTINQEKFRTHTMATGRAARIASALAPNEVETIVIRNMNADIELNFIKLDKSELEKSLEGRITSQELLVSTVLGSDNKNHYTSAEFRPSVNFPEFNWSMAPSLRNHIGGPEAFYLGQLWWRVNSSLKISRGLIISGALGFDIYNNFDEMDNPSYSRLPHVRSDIQEYLKEGKNNITRLKLSYFRPLAKDIYAKFDLGILEEMYGGFGTEILYRPFGENYAFGAVLNKVKKRDFDQLFSFREYEATTGHFQFFYDFPKVTVQLLAGKYLAGDIGLTVDVSRRFKNGFLLGAFATKTNVSSEEFGEGGFDKGFYFSIPLDILLPTYQTGKIGFGMHPLTRDGGAILHQHHSLYGITGGSEKRSLLSDWDNFLN